MTRVCHVISGYYRNDARVFQRQCKSLKKAGLDVCLLTNDGEPEEILDGIKIYSCETYWANRMKVLLCAKHQFFRKAVAINADIYQMHSPELISLGLSLMRLGKTIIYDAHEDLPRHILEKEWIPVFMRRSLSWLVELFMNRSLKKYHEIISPHTHVVNQLKAISDNVSLVANFPLVNSSSETSYEDYLKRGNIMCYTGTVYLYSNQKTIFDAMLRIPHVYYEIAGYIEKSHLQKLSEHSVYNRVKFLGRIPWSQMKEFYKRTILGIVVYDYKFNLGYKLGSYGTNKIFEYMEAGIPLICTDYDLWKEIIDKYECGICVQPNNAKQIEDAINYLIENKERAYRMGQNGREAVLQEFNWETQEITYNKIYKKYIH